MQKIFLRRRQVAQRYGDITLRSVDRAVAEGRIPAPEYPFGPHSALWDLQKLEENERATIARGGWSTRFDRLLNELATASRDQATAILREHQSQIDALSPRRREKLCAAVQDIINEIPDTD